MRTLLLASSVLLAVASPAVAVVNLGGPVVVPNDPATGAAGVTVNLGTVSVNDSFVFTATATPFLQPGATYGTNAAGVVTVAGMGAGVGGSLIDGSSGYTYGALIATLIINGNASGTTQVFATNAQNGLGSATPPLALTYTGTLGTLFTGTKFGVGNASINFRVDDSGYTDNSGGFLLTQTAAVPEPASWALMISGFGLVGATMRRRKVVFAA